MSAVLITMENTESYTTPSKTITIVPQRDEFLSDIGISTLQEHYLLPNETPQHFFARIACDYGDNQQHAQRIYDAISRKWLIPEIPALLNAEKNKTLAVSHILDETNNSLKRIAKTWTENENLYPESTMSYIPIWHPEIEKLLEIHKLCNNFDKEKSNIHYAVVIPDDFMIAVKCGTEYDLRCPKNEIVVKKIDARALFQKILEMRIQTEQPHLLFIGAISKTLPGFQKELGLFVKTSGIYNEAVSTNAIDDSCNEHTKLYCLSSLNLETYLEWKNDPYLIEDTSRFLDNILKHCIHSTNPAIKCIGYNAVQERAVGLGVLGWHAFLQSQNIPFESAIAKSWNIKIFKHIHKQVDEINKKLSFERDLCKDSEKSNLMERFFDKIIIAPTHSISIINGETIPGIEPELSNVFTHEMLSDCMTIKNKHLKKTLQKYEKDNPETWSSIMSCEGSVQHLPFLDEQEKAVFKTAFELDQRWLIEHATDRAPFIYQKQSLNLFLYIDIEKWDLLMLHWTAWEKGLKGLYYCHSKSVQRTDPIEGTFKINNTDDLLSITSKQKPTDFEECLACQ